MSVPVKKHVVQTVTDIRLMTPLVLMIYTYHAGVHNLNRMCEGRAGAVELQEWMQSWMQ